MKHLETIVDDAFIAG